MFEGFEMTSLGKAPFTIYQILNSEELLQKCRSLFSSNSTLCNDINAKYLYWDKVKYYAKAHHLEEAEFWGAVKLSRNYIQLSFGKDSFLFHQSPEFSKTLNSLDSYLLANHRKESSFSNSNVMEEAIASSLLEGANMTFVEAERMLLKKRLPMTIDEQMVFNNYQAMQYVISPKTQELTLETLLHLHLLMTYGTLKKAQEGAFRQNNSIVVQDILSGEVVHLPVDYQLLKERLQNLCDVFNGKCRLASSNLHPILVGILLHFYLSFLHPFCDGNGRIGRTLYDWYLLKNGYDDSLCLSISKCIFQSKTQYEKSFQYLELDDYDVTYFVVNQLNMLKKASGLITANG